MSTARKKLALSDLKKSRQNRALGISRTEEYSVRDVSDVYEEISEDQFVKEQDDAHDFVVDDDGLGYNDDGQEVIFKDSKKRIPEKNLAKEALKRQRKKAMLLVEDEKNHTAAKGSRSMYEFLGQGSVAKSKARMISQQEEESSKDISKTSLDDLLQDLDQASSTRRTRINTKRYGGRSYSSHSRNHTPSPLHTKNYKNKSNDMFLTPTKPNLPAVRESRSFDESPLDSQPFAPLTFEEEDDNENDNTPTILETQPAVIEDPVEHNEPQVLDETKQDNKPKRPKLKKLSAAAQLAMQRREGNEESENKIINNAIPSPVVSLPTSPAVPLDLASKSNIRPVYVKDEDISDIVKEEASSENSLKRKYLDIFWIDAHESKGVITLFGKVQVQDMFRSCSIAIHKNVRNFFVLPKDDVELRDVHKEIKSLLQPKIIPHVQGATWAGKMVQRNYAFQDVSIPNEPTDYFKVVYDAKYPPLPQDVCEKGGVTFRKILGWSSSVLETFIIKRKLMGPCWVRVYDPTVIQFPATWCKYNFSCDTPKDVLRMEDVENSTQKAPPPMTVLSLKLQTIVNPKTHKSEIVAISTILHENVLLDSQTGDGQQHMTHTTLVRPLSNQQSLPRDFEAATKNIINVQAQYNERSLLNYFMAQLGKWDPDVIVGHNSFGYDLEVLLNRCKENKVTFWSKLGRKRNTTAISTSKAATSWMISEAMSGRILCDTYLSAKEFLQSESLYSLTHLAKTQLQVDHRVEIDPVDVPCYFESGAGIAELVKCTLHDAFLVLRLMLKLQVLPLTKQLTCIAGNLWSRTIKGNRADRNEYLLLHEFHTLKYIVPEKYKSKGKEKSAAKYSGGLVLEPKKGLYDSFILLLDFNSLYPSIIQEYNLCFTTLDWATIQKRIQMTLVKEQKSSKKRKTDDIDEDEDNDAVAPDENTDFLPALPKETSNKGVLPRVIKTLVERRKNVKKMLGNERDESKKQELNNRQLALKLTANSMYGCLGFSNSRFYAQPIAALITSMGREALQRTVDIAQNTLNMEVIYGDTDSVMINTHLRNMKDLPLVKEMGVKVKREVNRMYKTLELEIDGVFQSMLLLKKKKYAALAVEEGYDGKITTKKEMKGLDLVRRDWCQLSKDAGIYVLDKILSGQERDNVIQEIHSYLEDLSTKMKNEDIPLDKYVIIKGLNKHPDDYPDAKSLPHVHVARRMIENQKIVNAGDHIPYVIIPTIEGESDGKSKSISDRARHPDEIERSNGALKPDIAWYLTQQILPPIGRLCQPIEGTSQAILAEKLGLDGSKFGNSGVNNNVKLEEEDDNNYIPMSCLPDSERFQGVDKLYVQCSSCKERNEFLGVRALATEGTDDLFRCTNPECEKPQNWGRKDTHSCVVLIAESVERSIRKNIQEYYQMLVRCDDSTCGLVTRQISSNGTRCLNRGCNGTLRQKYTSSSMFTQLKYYDSLFDLEHVLKQIKLGFYKAVCKKNIDILSMNDKKYINILHLRTKNYLDACAYNWIGTGFFATLFGASTCKATAGQ